MCPTSSHIAEDVEHITRRWCRTYPIIRALLVPLQTIYILGFSYLNHSFIALLGVSTPCGIGGVPTLPCKIYAKPHSAGLAPSTRWKWWFHVALLFYYVGSHWANNWKIGEYLIRVGSVVLKWEFCTISLQSSRGIILWSKCLLRYVIGKKRNDTSTGGRGPAATWRRDAHLARRVADGARRDADHGKPPCQQRRPWPFASLSTPRSARRWRDLKTMTIYISLIKGGPRSWLAYLINWESSKAHELENKIVQVISTKAHELENKIVQVISTALAGHRVCMQTDHVICFPLRDY
jgi:hypothetical protein